MRSSAHSRPAGRGAPPRRKIGSPDPRGGKPRKREAAKPAPDKGALERLSQRTQAIHHAISILEAAERGARSLDAVMYGYLEQLDAREPRLIDLTIETVHHQIYQRALLDWWILEARAGVLPSPRARMLAELALFEGRDRDSIARVFTGRPGAPRPLGKTEIALIDALHGRKPNDANIPAATRYAVPDWLEPRLRAAFGDRFGLEMAALAAPGPLDLRANRLKTDRPGALAALRKEGLKPIPTPLSPLGLRLDHRIDLGKCQALHDGLVEPQDEGSQLAALLVEAKPGMYVVDYCAGAGGKTLALAGAMQGRGRLIAGDVSAKRLERARQRFRRAGANVESRETTDRKWFKRQRGRADRVLIDAPCTGIGSWRRLPDARWRLKPGDVPELVAKQAKILDEAAPLVAAGGRLVYVTCSLLRDENEDQIAAFLARHPDFRVLPIGEVWGAVLKVPCPAEGDTLTLTPARNGTGGFFIAVLERLRAAGSDTIDQD